MPIYDYQCHECGLRFEQSVKFSDRENDHPCHACNQPANRLMPASVKGVFNKDVTGPVPQNTGIHSLDAHIDRVIGKSAAQGWATHENRVADKREVLRQNPEATGHDLTQRPDGSWGTLSKEERGFQDRALAINSAAQSSLSQRKRRPVGRA
jgi:putative FmdB family regulatory protein